MIIPQLILSMQKKGLIHGLEGFDKLGSIERGANKFFPLILQRPMTT
jgi:hypothetical protein